MTDTSRPPTLPEQREAIRFIRHCTDLELDYARIGIRAPNGTCPTRTDLVNALTEGHLDGRILLSNVHVCRVAHAWDTAGRPAPTRRA